MTWSRSSIRSRTADQLDGHHRYVLRLDQDPPVDAFWSITMYDLPDFYLVANPIDRYSIGDRTPGLRRDRDGSLTIVIQHEQPADIPATGYPLQPRRSGRSCASTSRRPPCWTAPTRSRPSPRRARPPDPPLNPIAAQLSGLTPHPNNAVPQVWSNGNFTSVAMPAVEVSLKGRGSTG